MALTSDIHLNKSLMQSLAKIEEHGGHTAINLLLALSLSSILCAIAANMFLYVCVQTVVCSMHMAVTDSVDVPDYSVCSACRCDMTYV